MRNRFNPRVRAGRDEADEKLGTYRKVSIHAPARGATGVSFMNITQILFQSTRPRGARPESCCDFALVIDQFQSTRPRGARLQNASNIFKTCGFNPRARAGRDRVARCVERAWRSFNPRARAGRDVKHILFQSLNRFNPRARATFVDPEHSHDCAVSIHAPARGATRLGVAGCWRSRVSIHASRAGRDHTVECTLRYHRACFNPRARAGRDQYGWVTLVSVKCFNPRARAGRDIASQCRYARVANVSIHAPARGATSIRRRTDKVLV